MSELSQPVTQRTIQQIARISDALFRHAEAIPGVGPDTELGMGRGVELEGDHMFVRLIKCADDPTSFKARTTLLAGRYGAVEVEDFRHNPVNSKARGVTLSSANQYGGFTKIEPSKGKIIESPSVDPYKGILGNHLSTRPFNDMQTRQLAAKIFWTMRSYLRQAEASSKIEA